MMEEGGNISLDSIQYAAEIGRLDFVSTALTILGAAITFATVVAYFNFKRLAKKEAKTIAAEVSKETAEKVANQYIQDNLLEILEANAHLFNGNIGDEAADKIASAQDNEEN